MKLVCSNCGKREVLPEGDERSYEGMCHSCHEVWCAVDQVTQLMGTLRHLWDNDRSARSPRLAWCLEIVVRVHEKLQAEFGRREDCYL